MIVIPAIDLQGGRCVRLRQGREDDSTVYSDDPVEMARAWAAQGAEFLHVVDLDGAFRGKPAHAETVAMIVDAINIPVEIGGGLRTDDDIRLMLDCGISRAIIGTRAFEDTTSLRQLVKEFGAQLAVGIDAREGKVQVKGWVETTDMTAFDLADEAAGMGVQTVIYTDTATDGMLTGPNLTAMQQMCETVSCQVVASGGVSSAEDVAALAALGCENLEGVIVGKALYEKAVTLSGLIQAARV